MKTFTSHKLTDPMLRRLSQIVNGRHSHYGVSLSALLRRSLVVEKTDFGDRRKPISSHYLATEAGVAALKQARREGW